MPPSLCRSRRRPAQNPPKYCPDNRCQAPAAASVPLLAATLRQQVHPWTYPRHLHLPQHCPSSGGPALRQARVRLLFASEGGSGGGRKVNAQQLPPPLAAAVAAALSFQVDASGRATARVRPARVLPVAVACERLRFRRRRTAPVLLHPCCAASRAIAGTCSFLGLRDLLQEAIYIRAAGAGTRRARIVLAAAENTVPRPSQGVDAAGASWRGGPSQRRLAWEAPTTLCEEGAELLRAAETGARRTEEGPVAARPDGEGGGASPLAHGTQE